MHLNKVARWAAPVVMVAATATFGLATIGVGTATAGKHLGSSPVARTAGARPAFNPSHGKLLKTLFTANGFSGATSGAGIFNTLDAPQTFTCAASKAPCTVEADMSVQVDGTTGPGAWAICLLVDGTTFNTCPYIDNGAPNGFFESSTQVGYVTNLPAGSHTVQMQVYTANAVTLYNYNATYHIYI